MQTIEHMTVTANGESRDMELRSEQINGKTFLSIWYAGDETGEFKQQDCREESQMRPIWQQYAAHFGVTPQTV